MLTDRRRRIALEAGPASFALNWAQPVMGAANINGIALPPDPVATGRPLSGSIALSFGTRTSVTVAFSESADREAATGDFLLSRGAASSPGFDRIGMSGMAMRTALGHGLALTAGAENGSVMNRDPLARRSSEQDGYALVHMGLEAQHGSFLLHGSLSVLREDASVLGARFGAALGDRSGRTLFADVGGTFSPGGGWTLALQARRGWTRASDLRLQSSAWSLDAGRVALLSRYDRFGLRLSQPLRVEKGGLSLLLPVAYDYASGEASTARRLLSLSPSGRQIDAEASYGLPVASGWLALNGYWRRQSGHIAAMPDDLGTALRYSVNFYLSRTPTHRNPRRKSGPRSRLPRPSRPRSAG
jgi:hypothetical protein